MFHTAKLERACVTILRRKINLKLTHFAIQLKIFLKMLPAEANYDKMLCITA